MHIPQVAEPALKSMTRLQKLQRNTPEAKAESRTLMKRLKTLYKNNRKWFMILAGAAVGAAAYTKRSNIHALISNKLTPAIKNQIQKMAQKSSNANKGNNSQASTSTNSQPKGLRHYLGRKGGMS